MRTGELIEFGLQLGLDRVGVCSTEPFVDTRINIEERKINGYSDRLGFTFTDPPRSTDITVTYPWAKSLVVAALTYLPAAGNPGPAQPGTGRVARFSTEDHYKPMFDKLAEVSEKLRMAGHSAEILIDDNRLVDRAAAQRSGIGWWGKNTMILTPRFGPWILLGSVATDAELEATKPDQRSCGTCSACIPACPTGALVESGVLDARRCIAALLQQRGVIPREFRTAIGDRVYGCDDCLDACPPGVRILEETTVRAGRVDIVELLATDDETLNRVFDRFYVPGRKMRFLRRNMLIALGNSGDQKMVDVVAPYLRSDDALLVSHAIWAVGQLGGDRARSLLKSLDPPNSDPEVDRELQIALAGLDAPIGK